MNVMMNYDELYDTLPAKEIKDDIMKHLQKYILVSWPEIQLFMHHPRWSECIFCEEIEGHPCPDSSYMIPEEIYKEVWRANYEL